MTKHGVKLVLIFVVCLIITGILIPHFFTYSEKLMYMGRVKDGNHGYTLFFVKDGEIEGIALKNKNSIVAMKFNSRDLYNELRGEDGRYFVVVYYGIRSPLMNMYPNIVDVTSCDCEWEITR